MKKYLFNLKVKNDWTIVNEIFPRFTLTWKRLNWIEVTFWIDLKGWKGNLYE